MGITGKKRYLCDFPSNILKAKLGLFLKEI